jgi:hypothetical protein
VSGRFWRGCCTEAEQLVTIPSGPTVYPLQG